jgi:hypothetical protein
MKRPIAAKLIHDEPTTIKRCADDIACASVLSPEPHRSELADPGWCEEPCGDLGGASAQLALNLLCIVTAVVAALSLQRAFFRAPASPWRTLQPTLIVQLRAS